MDPVALAQAGPVAILLAGIAFLYRAFIKGDVVVGSMYREQVERADKAELRADKLEVQAERNTEAIEQVASAVKAANERKADAST